MKTILGLKTQARRDKFLNVLNIFFIFSLTMFILGLIFINFSELYYFIGFTFLEAFCVYFWIINLIVMAKWGRWFYFLFSIPFFFLTLVFYFSEFHPFLKGEKE